MERTPRLGVSKEGIRQCGCRLLSTRLRPQREAEHMAGGWFLTRERGIVQSGVRRLVQPRGSGRGSKADEHLCPSPKRMGEAGGWR